MLKNLLSRQNSIISFNSLPILESIYRFTFPGAHYCELLYEYMLHITVSYSTNKCCTCCELLYEYMLHITVSYCTNRCCICCELLYEQMLHVLWVTVRIDASHYCELLFQCPELAISMPLQFILVPHPQVEIFRLHTP